MTNRATLAGEKDKICCYNSGQLNYKSIADVANKKYEIEPALMELAGPCLGS